MPSEDGGAIVKLGLACARRRAALALPGARAQGGGVRVPGAHARARAGLPRARRRARPRAPRAGTELYARRRARGSERAAPPLRLPELRLLNARAGVCERESERSGGEGEEGGGGQRGGRGGGAAGGREGGLRGASARAAVRLHVTATQNQARPESGVFCVWAVLATSVPTAGGWRRPTVRETQWEARQRGCRRRGGDSGVLGSKCRT